MSAEKGSWSATSIIAIFTLLFAIYKLMTVETRIADIQEDVGKVQIAVGKMAVAVGEVQIAVGRTDIEKAELELSDAKTPAFEVTGVIKRIGTTASQNVSLYKLSLFLTNIGRPPLEIRSVILEGTHGKLSDYLKWHLKRGGQLPATENPQSSVRPDESYIELVYAYSKIWKGNAFYRSVNEPQRRHSERAIITKGQTRSIEIDLFVADGKEPDLIRIEAEIHVDFDPTSDFRDNKEFTWVGWIGTGELFKDDTMVYYPTRSFQNYTHKPVYLDREAIPTSVTPSNPIYLTPRNGDN